MRTKFKFPFVTIKELSKLYKYDNFLFNSGSFSVYPLLKVVNSKVKVAIHDGKSFKMLKSSKIDEKLVNENFFFIKKLKVGNFRFSKKQCIFKARKKK